MQNSCRAVAAAKTTGRAQKNEFSETSADVQEKLVDGGGGIAKAFWIARLTFASPPFNEHTMKMFSGGNVPGTPAVLEFCAGAPLRG